MRKLGSNKFLGREEYLDTLDRFYQKPGSTFTSVQGRRRVGKSEILKQFNSKHKDNSFIFSGVEDETSLLTRKRIIQAWIAFSGDSSLGQLKMDFATWETIFESMFNWANKKNDSIVFILDEIQWLSKKQSGFAGSLKIAYEKHKSIGKIKIIICGSSIRFFKNNKDHSEKALMGLTTFPETIVQPFTLNEVKTLYFPKWTNEEVALTYMMFGGIPYYLDELDPELPFRQSINKAVFCRDTIFLGLIDELVNVDFNKTGVETAKTILKALRHEGTTESSIVEKTKLDKTVVNKFLKALEMYEIISPKNKLRENLKNSHGTVYVISDFFINFYYQVLEPNKNKIKKNVKEFLFITMISSKDHYEIKDFSGIAFERLLEHCLKSRDESKYPKLFNKFKLITTEYIIGTFWISGKEGTQIDLIVEDDQDKRTRIIDCKWISGFNESANDFTNQVNEKKFELKDDHTREDFLVFSQSPSKKLLKNFDPEKVSIVVLDDFFG